MAHTASFSGVTDAGDRRQLVAAQDQPGADYALIIDVFSGAVAPDATPGEGVLA